MSATEPRYMHLMCFFDLPVKTKMQRRRASHFRKFLKEDGYTMLQRSVYDRICNGEESLIKHLGRIKKQTPKKGNVRVIQITDRQYRRMKLLIGEKTRTEEKSNGAKQLILF
jgi:CRISPR-associated protein Cas2